MTLATCFSVDLRSPLLSDDGQTGSWATENRWDRSLHRNIVRLITINGLLGSEKQYSQFDRETMSTNKIVWERCAEFIPATRVAEQNHRLTVGAPEYILDRRFFCNCAPNVCRVLTHRKPRFEYSALLTENYRHEFSQSSMILHTFETICSPGSRHRSTSGQISGSNEQLIDRQRCGADNALLRRQSHPRLCPCSSRQFC